MALDLTFQDGKIIHNEMIPESEKSTPYTKEEIDRLLADAQDRKAVKQLEMDGIDAEIIKFEEMQAFYQTKVEEGLV